MPRVPNEIFDCVFYLYESGTNAANGTSFGGTGFLVSIPSESVPGQIHGYAVTNAHVARNHPIIRLNTTYGAEVIRIDPADWEYATNGFDIAAIELSLDPKRHKVSTIPIDIFATEEQLKNRRIGPGDEVFMVGRFIDHDGGQTNLPSLRFGHISVMPSNIFHDYSGQTVESYCIDLNSRTGYSGSPVFVYQTIGSDLENIIKTGNINADSTSLHFLGIHWGQFPERYKIISGNGSDKPLAGEVSNEIVLEGSHLRGMSGMAIADPSWRVLELLMSRRFKEGRSLKW